MIGYLLITILYYICLFAIASLIISIIIDIFSTFKGDNHDS